MSVWDVHVWRDTSSLSDPLSCDIQNPCTETIKKYMNLSCQNVTTKSTVTAVHTFKWQTKYQLHVEKKKKKKRF